MESNGGRRKPVRVVTSTDVMVEQYSREIDVELAGMLPNGKHAAYRIRQLRWIDYAPMGGIPSTQPASTNRGGLDPEERQDRVSWMRRLVATCVIAEKRCVQYETGGPWVEEWEPIRIVDREPIPGAEPREIALSSASDLHDNAVRLFNALTRDVEHGGGLGSTEGQTFRGAATGGNRLGGKRIRKAAARDRTRGDGHSRRRDPARAPQA